MRVPGDVIDFQKARRGSDSESGDSDFSYDSQASDQTYVPPVIEQSIREDLSSDDDEAEGTLNETSSSRPASRAASAATATAVVALAPVAEGPKVVAKSRKISVSLESSKSLLRSSRPATPIQQHQSPYNLRSRSTVQSPAPALAPYTKIQPKQEAAETAENFGRLVKQMERITRRNATHIIKSVRGINGPSFYSSDDE